MQMQLTKLQAEITELKKPTQPQKPQSYTAQSNYHQGQWKNNWRSSSYQNWYQVYDDHDIIISQVDVQLKDQRQRKQKPICGFIFCGPFRIHISCPFRVCNLSLYLLSFPDMHPQCNPHLHIFLFLLSFRHATAVLSVAMQIKFLVFPTMKHPIV